MNRLITGVALATVYGVVALGWQGPSADRGVRVSGTVVDAYAGAMPVPEFVTMGLDFGASGFPIPPRRAMVGKDRRFTFDDVAPGVYRLITSLDSVVVVTVGTADVTGVQLRHMGLTELYPSVRMDDGSDVPEPVGFHIEMGEGRGFSGRLAREWPILLPPGRRFFFVQAPEGVYVRSIVSAGVDLMREPLIVDPRAPERGIQVELTRLTPRGGGLARVSGRVTGGAGRMTVQLSPTMSSQRKRAFALALVAADGSFDVEIEPGLYDLHVPPAFRVVQGLAVPLSGTAVDVKLPEGRLFGGGGVRVVDPEGRSLPFRIGPAVIAARGVGGVSRFPVEAMGFWGALPPGAHHLTIENLPAGVSVVTLEAEGRNLLQLPYIVAADRDPPPITLVLRYTGPVPDWARGPSRGLGEIVAPGGDRR